MKGGTGFRASLFERDQIQSLFCKGEIRFKVLLYKEDLSRRAAKSPFTRGI
jgi:hypothetical protein